MTEELLVKTLLDARPRWVAGTFAVVRDAHLAEDVFQEVLLRMRYDEGRKGEELARRRQRSEAAIYKTLSRLHQALRQCINQRLAAQEGA